MEDKRPTTRETLSYIAFISARLRLIEVRLEGGIGVPDDLLLESISKTANAFEGVFDWIADGENIPREDRKALFDYQYEKLVKTITKSTINTEG